MMLRVLLISLVAVTITYTVETAGSGALVIDRHCPVVPDDIAGTCDERCTNCKRNELCCSNGCGHVCKKACPASSCPRCRKDQSQVGVLNERTLCITCKCVDYNPCAAALCLAPSNCIIRKGNAFCVPLHYKGTKQ